MLPELETLAHELERNRHDLIALVKQLDDEELKRVPRAGQYAGRELLAHLAGAERGMTRLMQNMAAGLNPRLKSDYNNDYYNARQIEKRAHMTVAALGVELTETRRELLTFMEALKPEDLDKHGEHPIVGAATVCQVLETLRQHEQTHIEEFADWARRVLETHIP